MNPAAVRVADQNVARIPLRKGVPMTTELCRKRHDLSGDPNCGSTTSNQTTTNGETE